MSVQLTRHRFTWDDYHAMVAAGALRDDDRVELIEGEIVDRTPIGSRHGAAVDLLNRWLVMGCGTRAIVRVQGPVRVGAHSEPQPDLLVLVPRDDFYRGKPPTVDDVLRVCGTSHCVATAARDGRSSVLHPPPSASTSRALATMRRPRMSTAVRSSARAVSWVVTTSR